MKINICPICIGVSSLWFILSALAAWGYIGLDDWVVVIALLMGGSAVGIGYVGEKRYLWAARHPQRWKFFVIGIGMLTAYLALINLSKSVVILEALILIALAYFFFIKRPRHGAESDNKKTHPIEEQMKQCC